MLSQSNCPAAQDVARALNLVADLPRPKKSTAPHKHARKAARIAKTRALIDALRLGELRRDQIGPVIDLGPSGERKYIKDLRDNGVVELARYEDTTPTRLGHPVYKLVDDAERVEKFLLELPLAVTKDGTAKRGPPTHLEIAARNPSRHFHLLRDDEYFAVRVSKAPPARDPLVAALFGAPRAQQPQRAAA